MASSGQLDLDGTSMTDAERAGRDALAVHHLAEPMMASLDGAGDGRAVPHDREPARPGAGEDGARRHRRRRRRAPRRSTPGCRPRSTRSAPSCASSPDATTSTSTRRSSSARSCYDERGLSPGQEDQVGLLHRRRDAREAQGPVARVPRPAAAPPRGREAARHLRRGPARRGRRRRSHPRHVQPDRRPHRSAVLRPAEPPQHPGPHRRGPPVPHGVRPGRGHARCWSPTTTRSSCAASPTSPPIPA